MDISEQIGSISKGRQSLTDALNQMEVVKQAFQRSEEVKQLLEKNDLQMHNLRSTMHQMVSMEYFTSRMSEYSEVIEKSIRHKFDEFSSYYFSQLMSKLSAEELEPHLNKKVGWSAFNNLSQQVGSIQTRFDKHIYSEYEGFKTKMKLDLASKASESKGLDINNEEFSQLKGRIVSIEQKLEEMFMEEDALQDDEDYDSQEEMDNMMDDIDIVAKREDTEEMEGGAELEDIQSTSPELVLESNPFKSDASLTSEITVVEPNNTPELSKKIEQASLEIEKPVSRQSKVRGNSIGGESKAMQRRSSKESSVAASKIIGGANMKQVNRKIANMQKEIDTTKLDIEEKQAGIDRVEQEIRKTQNYIEDVEVKVKNMLNTLDVMEASFIRALRRNGIDKKLKKQPETIVNFPQKQLESIEKNIEEKMKRIIVLECNLEKSHTETMQMKKFYREKLNEIIQSLKYFEDSKQKLEKNAIDISNVVASNHKLCTKNFSALAVKYSEMSMPLTDLISDQQRENQIMSEELKRNQEIFRALVESYSSVNQNRRAQSEEGNLLGAANKIAETYFRKNRNTSATPDLTVKSKFYKTNYAQLSPQKNDSTWFGSLPDGKAISLPRVAAKDRK